MTNKNKMTVAENFAAIRAALNEQGNHEFDVFIEKRLAMAEKSKEQKANKKAVTDAPIIAKVEEVLRSKEEPVTAGSIAKEIEGVSTQKVTAMLRKMNNIEVTYLKREVLYSLS